MTQSHRRQSVNDSQLATKGVGLERTFFNIQSGTHAMAGYAGTISFHRKFSGTPIINTTVVAGSPGRNSGGVRVISRYSGSFTYYGSQRRGTFNWLAFGSAA